ncbi:MAG: hypothetical protein NTX25_03615 [Proteobacteria bacterium]|nr:hypothetical protein [Pseudomonadota bacterium]
MEDKMLRITDFAIHNHLIEQNGIALIRARSLNFIAIFSTILCMFLLSDISNQFLFNFAAIYLFLQCFLVLSVNRMTQNKTWISIYYMLFLSSFFCAHSLFFSKNLVNPGLFVFPLIIMCNSMVIGGMAAAILNIFVLLGTILTMFFEFENSFLLSSHGFLVFFSALFCGASAIICVRVLHCIWNRNEQDSIEQSSSNFQHLRLHELSRMAGNFCGQTNGPLDILGTALHNIEEPILNAREPIKILPLLDAIESSVRELALISSSFSLFSKYYADHDMEIVRISSILQHVDTIFNRGNFARASRLTWLPLDSDWEILSKPNKLVMLLVSLLRNLSDEGAQDLRLIVLDRESHVNLEIFYRPANMDGRAERKKSIQGRTMIDFDQEVKSSLVEDLASELGLKIQRNSLKNSQAMLSFALPKKMSSMMAS